MKLYFTPGACSLSPHIVLREAGIAADLMGAHFTVADAYLFVMTQWAGFMKIDLGQWARLKAYAEQVAARPKVHEALKEEGLAK